jgi:hypothetical protein
MAEFKPDVTALLRQWGDGDIDARDRLIPLVYQELRKNAAGCWLRSAPDTRSPRPVSSMKCS